MRGLRVILISMLSLNAVFAPPPDIDEDKRAIPHHRLDEHLFKGILSRLHTPDDLVIESARLDSVLDVYDMQISILERQYDLMRCSLNRDITIRKLRTMSQEFEYLKFLFTTVSSTCPLAKGDLYTRIDFNNLAPFHISDWYRTETLIAEMESRKSTYENLRTAALAFKAVLHTYQPQLYREEPLKVQTVFTGRHADCRAEDRPDEALKILHLDPSLLNEVKKELCAPYGLEEGLASMDVFLRLYDRQNSVFTKLFELAKEAQNSELTALQSEALNIRFTQLLAVFDAISASYGLYTTRIHELKLDMINLKSNVNARTAELELERAKREFDNIRNAALLLKERLPIYCKEHV